MSNPQRANMSFQQSVLMAAKAQTKEEIRAEVVQAASILTNETKKSLISIKQRLDAIEDLVKSKLGLTDQDITEALWATQEKAYGLELTDTPAATGSAVRFRVKEEQEGKETDAPPSQESYVVLGNDDDQLPKEIIDALTGVVAGDTRKVTLYSEALKSNYIVSIIVDRVYKEKSKNGGQAQ